MRRVIGLVIFLVCFFVFARGVFAETPPYIMKSDGEPYAFEVTSLPATYEREVSLTNLDPERSIMLVFADLFGEKTGWTSLTGYPLSLAPGEKVVLPFSITIPEGVCDGYYDGSLRAYLADYEGSGYSSSGISVNIAISRFLTVNVSTGESCDLENPTPGLEDLDFQVLSNSYLVVFDNNRERIIFYDKDGDGEFEPLSGEKIISKGIARVYDENDQLLTEADLSVTLGEYILPEGTIEESQDFYITVDTSQFDGDVLATDWEENLYVNRTGTNSSPANSFRISGISSYDEMTQQVDLRSRNTDWQGNWEEGTISIGPDDKDQIISPMRWDMLTEGTDFPYADLDHDGRIDPDDKDHIISPLYWDFPN